MSSVPDLSAIGTALRALADDRVTTGALAIDERWVGSLHASELSAVQHARPGRAREFATGRALLKQLSGSATPIPVGPDRRPLLPAGVTGSLAHDVAVAVAAVSRDVGITALGVDVEPFASLDDDVARLVLRPDEEGLDPLLAFTVKEAVYKAWSSLGGRLLEHHDVHVELSGVLFVAHVLPDGFRVEGRHSVADARHLALAVVER